MKKFSLKRKTVTEGRIEKKVNSFSLKSKKPNNSKENENTSTNNLKRDLPGFEDYGENIPRQKNFVKITNLDEITNKMEESGNASLVIVPPTNSNYLQIFLAKQAEQEKQNIKDLPEDNSLEFGLNKLDNEIDKETTTPSTNTTAKASTNDLSGFVGGKDVTDESYNKVPVSKFGLAMLRGMGWSEELEKDRRKEAKQHHLDMKIRDKKHVPLVGLGAHVKK